MATTVAVLEAALHADTKRFDAAMGKSESKMQKLGKVAGVAGLAIAAGLAVAFKVGFDEMVASQKAMGQVEAAIKSTGGVANVTAAHVDELSQQLLELSGVDDELITQGQSVLLSFKNIRNEVGKGNDIFDQATLAALDLSTRMGTDLQSAIVQVGKAMNDPTKNLGKLQRSGVDFTKGQVNMIKKLQASGDIMGAQKIILAELREEFGGSAKAAGDTLPGKLNKAREAFADVAAVLVEELLPAFTLLAEQLTKGIGYLKEHPDVAKAVIIGLGILAGALIAASVAATLLNLALLANPVGLVVIAIVALIALLIVLYRRFEFVRTIVGFVRDHWMLLLLAFGLLPFIIAKIVQHFGTLKAIAMPVINAIRDGFARVKTAAVAVKDFIVGTLGPIVRPVLQRIRDTVVNIADAFQTAIGKVQDLIAWIGRIDFPDAPDWLSLDRLDPRNIGQGGGNAAGTSNRRAGWGWVGERGPELVNLPTGSRVYSNGVSSAMAGSGGGGTTIILNVPSSALVVDAGKLVRYIDDARRTYGRRGGA